MVVMSRDPAGFLSHFPEASDPHISFHRGDLRYSIFPPDEFSHVVHAASHAHSFDPVQAMDAIVWGTRRLLDFAVNRAKPRGFLYLSSSAVYGRLFDGVTDYSEDSLSAPLPQSPGSLIGNAHRMAEQMCSLFHQQYGLESKVARCFPALGRSHPEATSQNFDLHGIDLTVWLWRILTDGRSDRPYNVSSGSTPPTGDAVACISRAREDLGLDVWTPLNEVVTKTDGQPIDIAQTPAQPKTYVVDIDGVLASITPGKDYNLAQPLGDTIKRINKLYDGGHRIILFTARGSATGLDWRDVTAGQMQAWGVKYHELHFGKPAGDHYIDDRMIPLEML